MYSVEILTYMEVSAAKQHVARRLKYQSCVKLTNNYWSLYPNDS